MCGRPYAEAKKHVAAMEKCGVAKVLGISKLRNNYKPHEAKRKLSDSYDLFVVGPATYCSPRHQTRFEPLFLESSGIL